MNNDVINRNKLISKEKESSSHKLDLTENVGFMKLKLAFQRVLEQTSVWLWSRFFGSLTGTLAQVPLNSSPFNPGASFIH